MNTAAKASQITGANHNNDRNPVDFYPTPPEATIALMHFLQKEVPSFNSKNSIWEPACGEMDMSKILEFFGHDVHSTDLISGTDFLTTPIPTDRTFDAIITNPPFSLSEEFIRKSLQVAPVVCMLLKSQYFHAKKRIALFKTHTPARICPITWRLDFLKGAKGGRPTMECNWIVWIKGDNSARYSPLEKPQKITLFS
jgi:hypothetical protein